MKRRSRQRVPFLRSSLAFRLLMGLITVAGTAAFIHYQSIASYLARHYAPDLVHPYDLYADVSLTAAICAAALIYLSRGERPGPSFRRVTRARQWMDARRGAKVASGHDSSGDGHKGGTSGYNSVDDD
jgi:hypothetical protein